jgi:hypothetical protein
MTNGESTGPSPGLPRGGGIAERCAGVRPKFDLCRRRPVETLMRTEVGVVEEAYLDLRHEIFCHERPHQAQAERVLQRPPEALDQRDRALLPDCPKPLLHPKPLELLAKDLALEAACLIRDEVCRPSMAPCRPHRMRVDEEWVVKIDGTLWRARVAALRLKAGATPHFPEGCQLVDFKLLRLEPPNAKDVARTLSAPWKLCESHLAVVRRANDEAKTDAVSPTFSEE